MPFAAFVTLAEASPGWVRLRPGARRGSNLDRVPRHDGIRSECTAWFADEGPYDVRDLAGDGNPGGPGFPTTPAGGGERDYRRLPRGGFRLSARPCPANNGVARCRTARQAVGDRIRVRGRRRAGAGKIAGSAAATRPH